MTKRSIEVGPDLDLDNNIVIVDGTRLTEAEAEAWSDNIAADRTWDNLIPGRKSLSGGSKHSPVINVRVSETTRNRLDEIATATGLSISKIAREAIDAYVNNSR